MPTNIDELALAKALEEKVCSWRHHLHAHPELSFEEVETTAYLKAQLEAMGAYDLKVGCPGHPHTGLVADLRGAQGPRVAWRTDIDALPVTEELNLPFTSVNQGKMHACGHDAHMALALGVAQAFADHPELAQGRSLRLIFQPAEEKGGGAECMVAGGAIDGVEALFGCHIWSPTPLGTIEFTDGPLMAEADLFTITLTGKGGHGSMPHLSIDPVACALTLGSALQTLVSREVDPLESFVLSICKVEAGTAGNIIPQTCTLTGTTRFFDLALGDRLMGRIEEMAHQIAGAHRCTATYQRTRGAHPLINDKALAHWAMDQLRGLWGEKVVFGKPTMAGEDFGNYLERVPGLFFFLGTGPSELGGTPWPQHHPLYEVSDSALVQGLASALRLLSRWRPQ